MQRKVKNQRIVKNKLNLLFVLLFFSFQSYCQTGDNRIFVDSLIKNQNYASSNFSKVENRDSLIGRLLMYKGDFNINPTWKLITHNDSPAFKEKYGGVHINQATSNELIALYLIEATIRNDLYFKENNTYISLLTKDAVKYEYNGKILPPYQDRPYLYNDDGSIFYKMLLNQKHIKKIYRYYKVWFKRKKRLKISINQMINKYGMPLDSTCYTWNIPRSRQSSL